MYIYIYICLPHCDSVDARFAAPSPTTSTGRAPTTYIGHPVINLDFAPASPPTSTAISLGPLILSSSMGSAHPLDGWKKIKALEPK